ncbi:MAG: pyridoxal phosphate enzyme (YggS family) [Rhodothermales bacterium]|jgi:pyridoxal phosphate enzyme (YggS family)
MSIAENLVSVQQRVDSACERSGRDPGDVRLVGVSKTFPLATLQAAADAGLRVFGENKAQEIASKRSEWSAAPAELEWHFIGHLQRNKSRLIAEHANVFHALDSSRLARALNSHCGELGRRLVCFLQVNVSGEDSKFGVAPSALGDLLDAVSDFEHLDVTGLMTLAAPVSNPEDVRPQFALLRDLAQKHSKEAGPQLAHLSMGMSGDFEIAVEEGATHVRVGSAIFGYRSYP